MSQPQRRGIGCFPIFVLALAVGLSGVIGYLILSGKTPLLSSKGCRAAVDGVEVEIDAEQGRHAGLMAAIAIERGLPARAVSIALATAFQESKLRNIDYGDRDSLGLFQQRPSQGWGTPAQVTDPVYATNAFYDALVKVDGYEQMRITEAAQTVQRSAYPEAYEQHATGARALASALTGHSPAAFYCLPNGQEPSGDSPADDVVRDGLTGRAAAVDAEVSRYFGAIESTPGDDGRGLTLQSDLPDVEAERARWAVAHYLTSQAQRLGITSIELEGRRWETGEKARLGWRKVDVSTDSVVVRVF